MAARGGHVHVGWLECGHDASVIPRLLTARVETTPTIIRVSQHSIHGSELVVS